MGGDQRILPGKSVPLRTPVDIDGTHRASLTMRAPLVRDQLAAAADAGSDLEVQTKLIGNLCEISPEGVGALTSFDFSRLLDVHADLAKPAEKPPLQLREPTVADQLEAERLGKSSPAEREITLFARLGGVDRETLEEMPMGDYAALQDVYRGFFS